MRVLNQGFDNSKTSEEKATAPLAGGIMQHGYQCGMIWGAALAAGAEAFRLSGSGSKAETRAVKASQQLVETFRAQNKHINCLEITDIDKTASTLKMVTFFLLKGGTIGCFRMAAKFAPQAYEKIEETLYEEVSEFPPQPVSCASLLAKKMGFSDEHQVMAAGLAGGIGLSGGACGALGAAIWLKGLQSNSESGDRLDFNNPATLAAMEKFLEVSDYEFECSEIVGRKFENVEDHADYIACGGCSKILDQLAL
ncbi:MAG: C-GCAxxG-C-C family protein [FCB group bacterium]|nr:C-GCAxxG-C-C family protein [FCB group bacterium]MBL7027706.1 C-GCAxxG-C-C family protein [Candidatus Neomarinimicrobiota bacterium]MBL7121047.1 C-GCAxxG-C-C family protein [Candidatus Neomarinimicrobiota bacterium]